MISQEKSLPGTWISWLSIHLAGIRRQLKGGDVVLSSFSYSIAQYVILAAGFVKGIVQAKYLGPAMLGTYGLMVLMIEYMRFANLGIISGMNLEIAILKGQPGVEPRIRQIMGNVLTYLLGVVCFFCLAAVAIYTSLPSLIADDIRPYWFFVMFLGVTGQFKIFATYYARLEEQYHWMNRIELTSGLVTCALTIAFVAVWQLEAVVFAMAVSAVLVLCMTVGLVYRKCTLGVQWHVIRALIVAGFPLLLYNLCEKLFTTADRLVIVNFLSREDMGYFTLSNAIFSATMVVLSSLTVIAYPKVLRKFNLVRRQGDGVEAVLCDLKHYTALLTVVVAGLGLFGIVLIGPFIRFFLPQYEPSVLVYQLLTLGMVFDNTTYFAGSYLISNKHQWVLIGLLLGMVALTAGGNLLIIHHGWGIAGVAGVTCCAMIGYGFAKMYVVIRKLGEGRVRALLDLYMRLGILLASVLGLLACVPNHLYIAWVLFALLYQREIRELTQRAAASFTAS